MSFIGSTIVIPLRVDNNRKLCRFFQNLDVYKTLVQNVRYGLFVSVILGLSGEHVPIAENPSQVL